MSMPRIAFAWVSASAAVVGELDPAGLAAAADLHLRLDHDGVAELAAAASTASATDVAWRPSGTGTPCFANSCLPWYSRRSMR